MSFVGYTKSYAYCASKSGVVGLTRAIALDYAADNIRANCICPGFVDTAMVGRIAHAQQDPERAYQYFVRQHPLGRLGRPEDIAYGALYLASEEASFVTGTTLVIDGGYLAR
jgi:NAD(P)-dependent dehydrogenase (short-subunit alcohol dehydrogenase family)